MLKIGYLLVLPLLLTTVIYPKLNNIKEDDNIQESREETIGGATVIEKKTKDGIQTIVIDPDGNITEIGAHSCS